MMDLKSRRLTAFVIMGQHFAYKRVPFWLTNALIFFQRVMKTILFDLPFIRIFLDDILVLSGSETEHVEHLKQVVNRLKQHRAAINFEKSSFFQGRVPYLGHVVSGQGIQPDPTRVDSFQSQGPYKAPHLASEARCGAWIFSRKKDTHGC